MHRALVDHRFAEKLDFKDLLAKPSDLVQLGDKMHLRTLSSIALHHCLRHMSTSWHSLLTKRLKKCPELYKPDPLCTDTDYMDHDRIFVEDAFVAFAAFAEHSGA